MYNWNSPDVQQSEAIAFVRLQHALAGVYFWEFAATLDFDWSAITRKRKFGWPMVFYFLGRYCLLFAFIGLLLAIDVTDRINCSSLLAFLQFAGDASVGLASINLAIRTMAIWRRSPYVVAPLVVLILGHWGLIFAGIVVHTQWEPGQGCVIISTNRSVLSAMFLYSMVFDLIVLLLSAWRLYDWRARRGLGFASPLTKLLFRDGIFYFVVAFAFNLVAATFMLLNLNPLMSSIFNVPAATASTIVACRVVRRLFRYGENPPDMYLSHVGDLGISRRSVAPPPNMSQSRSRESTDTSGSIHFAPRPPPGRLNGGSRNIDPGSLDFKMSTLDMESTTTHDDADDKARSLNAPKIPYIPCIHSTPIG
ncbi:hypothetical protein EIP91_008694 [Steccherinum ochraceum]|uniref:Transmembrane protein n=1 Tax=Steccherinum ochraceum TaxID=92696 RepID=A0A4R0R2H6_9APHY|nr:hypothetical protein EIP91_008694 [Steccherinum ochraceum]